MPAGAEERILTTKILTAHSLSLCRCISAIAGGTGRVVEFPEWLSLVPSHASWSGVSSEDSMKKTFVLAALFLVLLGTAFAQLRGRQLSADDQQRFDSYFSRWQDYRRTNNQREMRSMES